jgi:CheY-like chemotaxis protein
MGRNCGPADHGSKRLGMQPQISTDILLVEDNVNDAELAILALKRRNIPGEIVHVSDGAQLMDAIVEAGLYTNWREIKIPKVILLDLHLQHTSGLDLLRQLKADARARAIPVVVFTASQREMEMVESYQLGVNSYVLKPATAEEFMQVVGDIGHYWLNVNQPMPR